MNKSFFKFDFSDITQVDLVESDRYEILSTLQSLHVTIPQNSKKTLTHTIASMPQKIFVHVQAGASVTLLIDDQAYLQDSSKSSHIVYHIVIEQNAKITCLLGLMYSPYVNLALHFHLQGAYAQAQAFGVYGLDCEQQVEIKTYQMHQAPYTQSQVELKGMLKDQAQAHVQGLIYINQVAYKSDASQENKNIVCGQQARVVSVPSIEVLQHDVQCCHGSAVGQFDQKHLWYLQSRGLTIPQAYQLLIASFFECVVQNFENKQQFMEMLCQKMI